MRRSVVLWLAEVDEPASLLGLEDGERRRVQEAADPETAARRSAGYHLVRWALSEVSGSRPGDVRIDRTCSRCGAPHGPVHVTDDPELFVSVSHVPAGTDDAAPSPALVAVALTRLARVGLDLVRVADVAFPGFDSVALHPEDRPSAGLESRARVWARKEAVVKSLGTGLELDPASFPAGAPGVVGPLGPHEETVVVDDLELDDAAVVGAVALVGVRGPIPVTRSADGVGAGAPRAAQGRSGSAG